MSVLDSVTSKFRNYSEEVQTSGVVAAIFRVFQGRSTTFATVFTVCGIILAFLGKLTANYAMMVTAIQGLVVVGSVKEDWHQQEMSKIQQNVTNVNVTSTTTKSSSMPSPIAIPMEGQ